MPLPKKGNIILDRNSAEKGEVRGNGKPCSLEGCRGIRFPVRWPNGKLTWPCTKGMAETKEGWKIC